MFYVKVVFLTNFLVRSYFNNVPFIVTWLKWFIHCCLRFSKFTFSQCNYSFR